MGLVPTTTQAQPAATDAPTPEIQAYTPEEGTNTPFEMVSPKKGNSLRLTEPTLREVPTWVAYPSSAQKQATQPPPHSKQPTDHPGFNPENDHGLGKLG